MLAFAPLYTSRPSWRAFSAALQSRSNSIRNDSGQGVVAGTPGTDPTNWVRALAASAALNNVGAVIEDGIDCVDIQLTGTGAADTSTLLFEAATQVAALNGQTWTSAFFHKVVAGSVTNLDLRNRIVFRSGAGAALQTVDLQFTPTTGKLARSVATATGANASIAYVTSQISSGIPTGAYSLTIRIGSPNLHLGSFALSPIRTTTAARSGVHVSAGR